MEKMFYFGLITFLCHLSMSFYLTEEEKILDQAGLGRRINNLELCVSMVVALMFLMLGTANGVL